MDTILLAVIAGLQATTLLVVFVGTNFRARASQIPVVGGLIDKFIHKGWRSR